MTAVSGPSAARNLPAEYESSSPAVASPGQLIEPGERAGVFRIGGELLTDADGSSRITIPHYAAGSVDQLENPAAHRQQITFACWPAGPADGRGQGMSAVAPPVDA